MIAQLEMQLELARRDVEAEKENVEFAQQLLHQAGVDKAKLEVRFHPTILSPLTWTICFFLPILSLLSSHLYSGSQPL